MQPFLLFVVLHERKRSDRIAQAASEVRSARLLNVPSSLRGLAAAQSGADNLLPAGDTLSSSSTSLAQPLHR